jgi:hypothetical protein
MSGRAFLMRDTERGAADGSRQDQREDEEGCEGFSWSWSRLSLCANGCIGSVLADNDKRHVEA